MDLEEFIPSKVKVNWYKYAQFTNLPKTAVDAEAISKLLEEHRYEVTRIPSKLIKESDYWTIDPNKQVTQEELGNKLKWFLLEKANKQQAIIYFAGHGFESVNWAGDKIGYLATSDADSHGHNAIQFNVLNSLIHKSDLSSLVMLLDCCYAGSIGANFAPIDPNNV